MVLAASARASISSHRSSRLPAVAGASPSPPAVPYAASCHVSSRFILARNRLSPWYSKPYTDDRARSTAFFRSALPAGVFSTATRIFLSKNPILSVCGIGSFVTASYLLVRYGASPHVISRQRSPIYLYHLGFAGTSLFPLSAPLPTPPSGKDISPTVAFQPLGPSDSSLNGLQPLPNSYSSMPLIMSLHSHDGVNTSALSAVRLRCVSASFSHRGTSSPIDTRWRTVSTVIMSDPA